MRITDVSLKDFIALFTVLGGFYLISQGIDGTVGAVLIMVVSFYFAKR